MWVYIGDPRPISDPTCWPTTPHFESTSLASARARPSPSDGESAPPIGSARSREGPRWQDVKSYNKAISAVGKTRQWRRALSTLRELRRVELQPNTISHRRNPARPGPTQHTTKNRVLPKGALAKGPKQEA